MSCLINTENVTRGIQEEALKQLNANGEIFTRLKDDRIKQKSLKNTETASQKIREVNSIFGEELITSAKTVGVYSVQPSVSLVNTYIEQMSNEQTNSSAVQNQTSSQSNQSFDKELAQKIQNKLEALYPEIKLDITNTPIWENSDNVLNQKDFENAVNYRLQATQKVLDNLAKIQQWENNKSISNETFWKKVQELGIAKNQIELLKESEGNNIEEKLASFVANYSYVVEINTAKNQIANKLDFKHDGFNYFYDSSSEMYKKYPFGNMSKLSSISQEEYEDAFEKEKSGKNTSFYENLTAPGGTDYTENEIATPAITPSIKGHAQFSTDKGIGWFRSDEKRSDDNSGKKVPAGAGGLVQLGQVGSKTRRILELQSDLFQKGRDRDILISPTEDTNTIERLQSSENQFLQLLNKDNNWVTFFVKSIIQDSAKKGYEKVLFPTGDTASKVEGHETLEQYKKERQDIIKNVDIFLALSDEKLQTSSTFHNNFTINDANLSFQEKKKIFFERLREQREVYQQQLNAVEKEGFGALKPIFNFYENTVFNILKKQGYSPISITDEYGNTWYELSINQSRDLDNVLLQKNESDKIIGQANIKAMTVLVDAINQKQDTLPHEYAHHYIAWYRNTPIVQEAIKKWGSEEALVQSIGEQVVKQKGEAYNWWKKFTNWIMNQFSSLSELKKEELTNLLTDSFLTREDLNQPLQSVKPGVEELFDANPELANQVYSKILTNSGISGEKLLSLLEKDNVVEKDCKGSKLKAQDGIATLFEKGSKWEIVTDFKNAPTHKSGGKDISIQGKKVEVEKNELRIENDFGDVAVIPSKYRIEVQDAIKSNCHSCIDGIVESLPKMKDYAGDGTVFPFFGRYKRFKNSLPNNLKDTPESDYAMRYYWKHGNKPKSFDEAINRENPMFTMEDDGFYHAPSVEPNTLRFLKPKSHPSLQYELDWYNSDNPDAVDFRSKYDLDTNGKFYKYVPKKQ
jgi:hypothetical protein